MRMDTHLEVMSYGYYGNDMNAIKGCGMIAQ